VAAERNGEKWYKSWVKLLPAVATEVVQIYDPATKTFVDHPESDDDDVIVELDGPFAYFLATVNVGACFESLLRKIFSQLDQRSTGASLYDFAARVPDTSLRGYL
jgi:hypothetical protein